MSRAATAYDAPEIAAAVRAYRAAGRRALAAIDTPVASPEYDEACDARWEALRALEDALPTGAWFRVGLHLWGWAKRSRHGGLEVTSEPVACPWPRRERYTCEGD